MELNSLSRIVDFGNVETTTFVSDVSYDIETFLHSGYSLEQRIKAISLVFINYKKTYSPLEKILKKACKNIFFLI